MNGSYLITGGTGFIGANIVRALIKKKKRVVVVTRNRKLNWRLENVKKDIEIKECDINDPKLLSIVKEVNPDFVFHLAAYGVLPSEVDMSRMVDVNIKGTVNLVNALKHVDCKLMINAGSAVEYGIKGKPMKETDIINPINDYGVTKAAATLYCQKEALRNKMPIITFRLFTPYGYFEDPGRLMPTIMKDLLWGDSPKLSSPHFVRDFIFIDDVVDIFLRATRQRIQPGNIYNIGSGKQHSVESVFKAIKKAVKPQDSLQPTWGGAPSQSRQVEPKKWVADMKNTYSAFQWEPRYSFQQAIEKYQTWFRLNSHYYV